MRKDHWAAGCSFIYLTAIACQSAVGTTHGAGGSGATGQSVGGHTSAGGAATGGGPTVASETLTLSSVTAHVDGRAGDHVRFTISGTQAIGTLASVGILPFDSSSNEIVYFDTNTDGLDDSATGYYVPHPLPNETAFGFDLVIPITSELVDWKTAEVFLSDRSDAVSNKVSVDIESQPVRAQGDACDPTSKADRCADGFECSSASSTCVSHQRPSLTQVGYFTTDNGPLMIARGTDALDDLLKIQIDFLDSSGSPVPINITNDTSNPTMVSSFDETSGFRQVDGTFTFEIAPTASFTQLVKQVSLVPIDKHALRGAAQTANLAAQPSKGSGAPCDSLGFNYCSGNAVCVPGIEGASNACLPIGSAQSTVCKAAPTVAPSEGLSIVAGYVAGASLWEPPSSCAADTALHNPEFVTKLHLDKATPSITLTTARRETQIDTVLYVTSACSPTSTQILGCNDDMPDSGASSLTLSNLAAGDYYVIVDSRTGSEGSVGLEVTTP
jgi:hypothetical protein